MKPMKLKLCGWGSYPDEVNIDFTKFYAGNIFLITGPTGAGKTTIFDGISFALFGDVSGKVREKSSIRSDFATPQTETYVELSFVHKGEVYTIKRAPKYMRHKKRGDGFTASAEMAELYFEKELPITDVIGVNRKIAELLGMNYEQFKQTSMIAQGEFMELLVSGSKDKVEIFRNLFKTEKYDKLQHMLSEKARKLSIEIENLTSKIEEAIHGIDGGDNQQIIHMLGEDYINYNEIINQTAKLVNEDKESILVYEEEIESLDQLIKNNVAVVTEGEHNNNLLFKLKDTEKIWEELLNNRNQIEELKKTLNNVSLALVVEREEKTYLDAARYSDKIAEQKVRYDKEIKNAEPELLKWEKEMETLEEIQNRITYLQRESQLLESYLPMLEELKEKNKRLVSIQQKIAEQERKKQDMIETEKKLIKQEEKLKKELEGYVSLEKETSQHQLALQLCIAKGKKVEAAFKEYEIYSSINEELKQCQSIYLKVEEEFAIVKECCEEKETAYRNAAVGLVARLVKENEPCPVCGSLEHPNIAEIEDKVPDEKELEQFKKKLERKEKEFNQAYQKTAEKKAESDSRERELAGLLIQLELEAEEPRLSRKEPQLMLMDEKAAGEKELQRLLLAEKRDKEKAEQKVKIKKNIDKLEVSYKEYQVQKEKDLEVLYKLAQERAGIEGAMKHLTQNLPEDLIKGQEDIKDKLKCVTKEIQNKSEKIETIRENYQKTKSNLESWKVRYEKTGEDFILAKEEEENRKSIFQKVMLENGFLTEEEYKKAVKSKEETDIMNRELKKYEESCQFVQATISSLKAQVDEKPFINVEELHRQLSALEEKKRELLNKKEKMAARVLGNKRIIDSVLKKNKQMERVEEEYGMIKDLDNAAKGNNKERIVFEHYVLASYFVEILYSSNKHLFTMTGGRYELMKIDKVADARTKDSLDIEVLDHYTGKKRSVKSLSGGESFKAALSLALGLSDVVQRSSGGIQIDTLFIDEGFGSLDRESLEQAMDTITSLTEHNRLIGIISHVSELKERFDNQIIVEKETKGSKLSVLHQS